MYPTPRHRDADIDRTRNQRPDERFTTCATARPLRRGGRRAARHLVRAQSTTALRAAPTRRRVPWRRLVEVRLHHVDLGTGYAPGRPATHFAAARLDFLDERFDRAREPRPRSGSRRRYRRLLGPGPPGGAEGDPLGVSGPAADLSPGSRAAPRRRPETPARVPALPPLPIPA